MANPAPHTHDLKLRQRGRLWEITYGDQIVGVPNRWWLNLWLLLWLLPIFGWMIMVGIFYSSSFGDYPFRTALHFRLEDRISAAARYAVEHHARGSIEAGVRERRQERMAQFARDMERRAARETASVSDIWSGYEAPLPKLGASVQSQSIDYDEEMAW